MENKTKLLYIAAVSLIIGDLIPTPADALVFYKQRKLKEKLQKGEITPKAYWLRNSASYYLYNPLWWSLVLGLTYSIGSGYKQKRNLMLGLIASGAVLGVVYKNIKVDEKDLIEEEKLKAQFLKDHPEFISALKKPEYKKLGEKFLNFNAKKI